MTDPSRDEDRAVRPDRRDEDTTVFPIAPPIPAPPLRAAPLPPMPAAEPPLIAPPVAPPSAPVPAPMPPVYAGSPVAGTATRATARGGAFQPVGRVVFAGVVLLLFGAVEAAGGAVGAVFAPALRRAFDQALRGIDIRIEPSALTSVVVGTFVALLIIGVLHIAAASGVLSHRNWGRVLGVVLAILGVLVGAFLAYRAIDVRVVRAPNLLAALGVLVPYAISLASLILAGDHFHRRRVSR